MSDKLEYNFKNKDLLELALTHKSASKNNNERLEFLGDAIINFYVTEKLYEDNKDVIEDLGGIVNKREGHAEHVRRCGVELSSCEKILLDL